MWVPAEKYDRTWVSAHNGPPCKLAGEELSEICPHENWYERDGLSELVRLLLLRGRVWQRRSRPAERVFLVSEMEEVRVFKLEVPDGEYAPLTWEQRPQVQGGALLEVIKQRKLDKQKEKGGDTESEEEEEGEVSENGGGSGEGNGGKDGEGKEGGKV